MDSRQPNYHRNNRGDDDGNRDDHYRNPYKHRRYEYNSQREHRYQHQTSDNQSSSISSIVANHYNSIHNNDIQERKKSRIYYMRNFNNWVKSIIIRKYNQTNKRKLYSF